MAKGAAHGASLEPVRAQERDHEVDADQQGDEPRQNVLEGHDDPSSFHRAYTVRAYRRSQAYANAISAANAAIETTTNSKSAMSLSLSSRA